MVKFLKCIIIISFSLSTQVFAADIGNISFSISLLPDLSNHDVDDIPGHDNLNDSAYQYQLNYFYSKETSDIGFAATRVEYVSLRLFRFIESYDEDDKGASELEGIAFFYGQRFMASSDLDGLGFGWYGGFAVGTDQYVELNYNTIPIEEDFFSPLVAAELFYLYKISDSFIIEPSILFAVNKELGDVTVAPQLNLGIFFW